MNDFLKFLITPLLSEPDKLEISINGSAVMLHVADTDTGRIIGKHGAVINALRTLTRTYCSVNNQPIANLILNTPDLKTDSPRS